MQLVSCNIARQQNHYLLNIEKYHFNENKISYTTKFKCMFRLYLETENFRVPSAGTVPNFTSTPAGGIALAGRLEELGVLCLPSPGPARAALSPAWPTRSARLTKAARAPPLKHLSSFQNTWPPHSAIILFHKSLFNIILIYYY